MVEVMVVEGVIMMVVEVIVVDREEAIMMVEVVVVMIMMMMVWRPHLPTVEHKLQTTPARPSLSPVGGVSLPPSTRPIPVTILFTSVPISAHPPTQQQT